jgi:hypothetical protein
MEIKKSNLEISLGNLVRVELTTGITRYQTPEALDIRYPRAIRELCEREEIWLPSSFQVYERAAAQAAFIRIAEENKTLDILSTREALRGMTNGCGYEYVEDYNPYANSYTCERFIYIGRQRYADCLMVFLDDGTAYIDSTWGSADYWDRFVYPAEGESYYAGTVDDPYRQPPSWVVEKPRK